MITPVRESPAHIRLMVHDDIGVVSDVEQRSYDFPWSHGVFRDCLLAGYRCIVIERSDSVVGYGILSIAAGEAHILNLCVDPMYRELGYGELLLDEILGIARREEVEEIFLEVRPSNEKAIALYRKREFRIVAHRPAYYQSIDGSSNDGSSSDGSSGGGREDAAVYSRILK